GRAAPDQLFPRQARQAAGLSGDAAVQACGGCGRIGRWSISSLIAVTARVDSRASRKLAANIDSTPPEASQMGSAPKRWPANASTATARLVPTKQVIAM